VIQLTELARMIVTPLVALATLIGVIALQRGWQVLMSRPFRVNGPGPAAASLLVFGAIGVGVLWEATAQMSWPGDDLVSLRTGAVALYAAGWLVYVEVRSLLSRGYSLRILVDILELGGGAGFEDLKSGYGEGMGVRGLLSKRIAGLARIGLIRRTADQIGPLTSVGRLVAHAGYGMRRLLRLDVVG
jgi:hypothetical protein